MHVCPACAAPLDDDGICTTCGALTRGFFRGLELGTPQIAQAVANGLDFYLLLGVVPAADTRTIARRYRQLRVLFPDDPAHLAPEPARRFELLELAGRTLTDPQLRAMYDAMRTRPGAAVRPAVLRCAGCAAPLPPDSRRCAFCGTARPAMPQAPATPPESGPPAAEPVDYYALIGLNAEHLLPPSVSAPPMRSSHDFGGAGPIVPASPPAPGVVDAACLARQKAILLTPGYTADERDARMHEIEVARRILRDEQQRARYDMLLLGFRQGMYGGGRLDALRSLQELACADMADERGETASREQGLALLRQGCGYLDARLPREAVEPLRRAVAALPESADAHAAYVRALLATDDPLALGAHVLRVTLHSLEALEQLGAATPQHAALAALCSGLLARDQGDVAAAQAALRRAAALDGRLAPAWRGLAALALGQGDLAEVIEGCRRALAIDPADERALLMLCAAYLRAGQRTEARGVAAQIAGLRGADASADAVLRELGA